jgi:hypothetical protein
MQEAVKTPPLTKRGGVTFKTRNAGENNPKLHPPCWAGTYTHISNMYPAGTIMVTI